MPIDYLVQPSLREERNAAVAEAVRIVAGVWQRPLAEVLAYFPSDQVRHQMGEGYRPMQWSDISAENDVARPAAFADVAASYLRPENGYDPEASARAHTVPSVATTYGAAESKARFSYLQGL